MELTIGTGSKYGPINIRSKSKPIPVIKDATCERWEIFNDGNVQCQTALHAFKLSKLRSYGR